MSKMGKYVLDKQIKEDQNKRYVKDDDNSDQQIARDKRYSYYYGNHNPYSINAPQKNP